MKSVRRIGIACLLVASGLVAGAPASVQEYEFRIVASGLSRPVGIAVDGENRLVFTQVPTPGVAEGVNGVFRLDLESNQVTTLHIGEPEPTNVALDANGDVYWTCKSAGVILKQDTEGNTARFLGNLEKPTGLGLDRDGLVYFTEVPAPGVAGAGNRVSVSDGGHRA